jgi:hypothetical protein
VPHLRAADPYATEYAHCHPCGDRYQTTRLDDHGVSLADSREEAYGPTMLDVTLGHARGGELVGPVPDAMYARRKELQKPSPRASMVRRSPRTSTGRRSPRWKRQNSRARSPKRRRGGSTAMSEDSNVIEVEFGDDQSLSGLVRTVVNQTRKVVDGIRGVQTLRRVAGGPTAIGARAQAEV